MSMPNKKNGDKSISLNWKTITIDIILLLFTAFVMKQIILQWGWFAYDLAFYYVNIILTAVKLVCKAVILLIVLLLLWLQAIIF